MEKEISEIIIQSVKNILDSSCSNQKLKKLIKIHDAKIHFIPRNYRIFGGLLQSMNIQFGNFLEEFMTLLIKPDNRYEIIESYSGNKKNKFSLSSKNDERIDSFISRCQNSNVNLETEFPILLKEIRDDKDTNLSEIEHDIDILFRNRETGIIYYLEVKYNDDHDTGKFVDINRKFIKTYAYLVREFQNEEIKPILFFFNNKKLKGNIYVTESTNIRRGEAFFNEFLKIKYQDVDNYLKILSESPENIKAFNNLYNKIISLKG